MASRGAGHIAVVGMACRFPGADDPDQFWSRIAEGLESVCQPDGTNTAQGVEQNLIWPAGRLDRVGHFDAEFFGVTPRDAAILDPQHRLLLEAGYHALEDAGYDADRYGGDIGVFVAVGASSYLINCILKDADLVQSAGLERIMMANGGGFAATRLSYKLNLRGPSVCVDTTCSSSLTAVHLACRSLQTYECDMALAGGVRVIAPADAPEIFEEGGILSRAGRCRAFDADADGTVVGSGVGVVVLKRFDDAVADGDTIRALVIGSAMNNDGADKVSYMAPSVTGQARVISAAMAFAGIGPNDIHYIEAHGTGTPLGDSIELEGLKRAFDCEPSATAPTCAIGSVKSNIGHLDAAAGIAGFIKTVLAIERGKLPPTIHVRRPNPELRLDDSRFTLNTVLGDWPHTPRRAGVSSFGVGGTNVHVVLEQAPAGRSSEEFESREVMVLSARTADQLAVSCDRLCARLATQPNLSLADVAYTLNIGRKRLAYRCVVHAASVPEAVLRLSALSRRPAALRKAIHSEATAAFVFPGGGHYKGMLAEHYRLEPVCRRAARECLDRLPAIATSALEKWLEDDTRAPLKGADADLSNVYLFVAEYALAHLWMSWGIVPAALTGWGVGEHVSACLSGVSALDDCLAIVQAAGRIERSDQPAALDVFRRANRANVLMQVGPPVLGRGGLPRDSRLVASIGSINDTRSQRAVITSALARLVRCGVDIDWSAYYRHQARRRIPLPVYPFGGERYWPRQESPVSAPAIANEIGRPDVEAIVLAIWRELFGDPSIHRDSDFVELGGDSLLASQVVTRISERLGVPLDVNNLWNASSPARLAVLAGSIAWQRERRAADRGVGTRESGRL